MAVGSVRHVLDRLAMRHRRVVREVMAIRYRTVCLVDRWSVVRGV